MSIVENYINAEAFSSMTVQDTLFASALSDCSGKPDFKYVFDVYANGNQLTRVKLYPDPITAYGYFDAGPSVRNEINYGWMIATDANASPNYNDDLFILEPNQTNQIAINYDIRFGEEYISGGAYVSGQYVSGGTLVTLLNEASGTRKVYNYAAPLFNRKLIGINSFNNKFLSNRPKTAKCKLDGNLLIPIKLATSASIGINIKQYSYSNSLIDTFDSYIDTPAGSVSATEFYQMNIGPVAINNFLSGKGAIAISSNTQYYDIYIVDTDTGATLTNTFRVYIDCNPRYDSIDLYFMNQWGMFDTARFDLTSRLTMDIERKSFTKKDYYNYNEYVAYFQRQESKINYGSKMNWTYKLTMNYPTDEEYIWLAELISSPQIYANFSEITDGYLMPVTIKNTNYEYSKNQNNGLKTLEIEVEMNQTRYGFLR
jgi:hypothetical protein